MDADLATAARNQGFPILRDHTASSTAWILATGIARELERGRSVDVLLVDRPAPDALGYYYAALESQGGNVDGEGLNYLRELVRLHSSTYDVLLRTEIDAQIAIDTSKERDLDPGFRQLANDAIGRVFEELSLAHEVLTLGAGTEIIQRVVAATNERRDR